MTTEQIAAVAGVVLSLAASYIPGFNAWYAELPSDQKRLIMLGALLLVVGGSYALSCAGYLSYFPCTGDGATQAVFAFISAAVANQATNLIVPKPAAAK